MKRVRGHDKQSGEFLQVIEAAEITPPLRYEFGYRCMDPECEKTYHWRKETRSRSNAVRAAATFVENHTSNHRAGCRFDFEKIASRHRDVAFYQDGAFHLRVNFPLGGAPSDIYTPHIRLTPQFIGSVRGRASLPPAKPGISSAQKMVAFLEKEFGSIEAAQTHDLKLHYQGYSYDWDALFAASDHYEQLVHVPKEAVDDLTQSRLSVVQILQEKEQSKKGKRRFLCAAQDARTVHGLRRIRPIITVANDDIAALCHKMIEYKRTLLVAARPFMPSGVQYTRKEAAVNLYVADTTQMAAVSHDYWRPRPAVQTSFDF